MTTIFMPGSTTRDDKLVLLKNINASRNKAGELMIPDNDIYGGLYDIERIKRTSKEFLVWLEMKPTNLCYEIDNYKPVGLLESDGKFYINIGTNIAKNPYVATSIIAKSSCEYYLKRKKIQYDDELLELATVHFGLGVFMINAFDSGNDLVSFLRRFTGRSSNPRVTHLILSYFTPDKYYRMFANYLKINQLGFRACIDHLLPWSAKGLKKMDTNIKAIYPTDYVQQESAKLSLLRLKSSLMIVLICLLTVVVWLIIDVKPKSLPAELANEVDNINVLANNRRLCNIMVKQQQKSLDENDIFSDRQIDAQMTRCKSVENIYNYRLNVLNEKLRASGFAEMHPN